MVKFRRLLWVVVALGICVAVTSAWQRSGRVFTWQDAALAQATPKAGNAFQRLWSRPVSGLRAAALSPDGDYIGLVTASGSKPPVVSLWHPEKDNNPNRREKPVWARAVPGASQVAVSTGGRYALAFALLDPTQRALTLLSGAKGAPIARNVLDGAIWDVHLSADGKYAGVVTGNRALYLYTLDGPPRYHRWSLDGIGNSVALTRGCTYVAAGTWDDSGVSCFTRDGAALWQYPSDPQQRRDLLDRLFEAKITENGQYVLGLSYANVRQGDGTVYLWRSDGDGKPLWRHELGDDAFYPRAEITPDGKYVAVTYLRLITHGDQSIPERRLLVLDNAGNTLWNGERGGFLFAPVLIALAPDGHRVTVSDGRSTLYNLNADGRITAKYAFNGTIRQTMTSADGRFLLVYTGDGLLSLFQLS